MAGLAQSNHRETRRQPYAKVPENKFSMWIPKSVWQEFLAEHKQLRERVDRLTEAVARERGTAVMLPQTQPRKPTEKSSGWFDKPFNPLQENKQ